VGVWQLVRGGSNSSSSKSRLRNDRRRARYPPAPRIARERRRLRNRTVRFLTMPPECRAAPWWSARESHARTNSSRRPINTVIRMGGLTGRAEEPPDCALACARD